MYHNTTCKQFIQTTEYPKNYLELSIRISRILCRLINHSNDFLKINESPNTLDKQNVNRLVEQNINIFDLTQMPCIPLHMYIARVIYYCQTEKSIIVSSLIILDRIFTVCPKILTSSSAYKLFFICVVVCTKMYNDTFFTNQFYAKVGGISLNEINMLEIQLLSLLKFNLYVESDVYQTYDNALNFTL